MFLIIIISMCSVLSLYAMESTTASTSSYALTQQIPLPKPNGYASSQEYPVVVTTLPSKNALCIANNDAQLLLYDAQTCMYTNTLTPPILDHECCPQLFKNSIHDTDPLSIDAHNLCKPLMPRKMVGNKQRSILYMAKDNGKCSTLESYTFTGTDTSSLALKKVTSFGHQSALVLDLACLPDSTIAIISHKKIELWDTLSHKKIKQHRTGGSEGSKNVHIMSLDHNTLLYTCEKKEYGFYMQSLCLHDLRANFTNVIAGYKEEKESDMIEDIYALSPSTSPYCFLSGGEHASESFYNAIEERDLRMLRKTKKGVTRRFEVSFRLPHTIRAIKAYKNLVMGAVAEGYKYPLANIAYKTSIHVWDPNAPQKGCMNLASQQIKIADEVLSAVHINCLEDGTLLVADKRNITQLSLTS